MTDDAKTDDAMTDDPDARFRHLLSRQLVANEETWAALVAHGVDERTPLRLDFAFTAPDERAAAALADVLADETDYDVAVASVDDGAGGVRWIVTGSTQPAALSAEILDQWAEWMVTAGLQQGCDFDGWSTDAGLA